MISTVKNTIVTQIQNTVLKFIFYFIVKYCNIFTKKKTKTI
jgi:hypothetical protein